MEDIKVGDRVRLKDSAIKQLTTIVPGGHCFKPFPYCGRVISVTGNWLTVKGHGGSINIEKRDVYVDKSTKFLLDEDKKDPASDYIEDRIEDIKIGDCVVLKDKTVEWLMKINKENNLFYPVPKYGKVVDCSDCLLNIQCFGGHIQLVRDAVYVDSSLNLQFPEGKKDPMTGKMEDEIEKYFWEFDSLSKQGSMSTRDLFKGFLRRAIRESHGYKI